LFFEGVDHEILRETKPHTYKNPKLPKDIIAITFVMMKKSQKKPRDV